MTFSWRRRAEVLCSGFVMAILFRPADWPLGPGVAMQGHLRDLLNRACFLALMLAVAFTFDLLWLGIKRSQGNAPHPYWIGALAGILVCLTVDWIWYARPLAPGRDGIVPIEIGCCVVGLMTLLVFWFAADPIRLWFRKQVVLEPPRPDNP